MKVASLTRPAGFPDDPGDHPGVYLHLSTRCHCGMPTGVANLQSHPPTTTRLYMFIFLYQIFQGSLSYIMMVAQHHRPFV